MSIGKLREKSAEKNKRVSLNNLKMQVLAKKKSTVRFECLSMFLNVIMSFSYAPQCGANFECRKEKGEYLCSSKDKLIEIIYWECSN